MPPASSIHHKFYRLLTAPLRIIVKVIRGVFEFVGAIVTLFIASLVGFLLFIISSAPNLDALNFNQIKERTQMKIRQSANQEQQTPKEWVPLNEMNRNLIYSVVLSEDAHFFSHEGIEWDAILAASVLNFRQRKLSAGASTITQQTVKNIFLSHGKSFTRKIQEIYLTRKLESKFSKNEILELYLNLIEVGRGLYGVAHASEYYFNKKPSEINAAEGAFIAILLPSPRRYQYSFFENQNIPMKQKKKIKRILGDMLAEEYISSSQYAEYLNYPYFSIHKFRPRK